MFHDEKWRLTHYKYDETPRLSMNGDILDVKKRKTRNQYHHVWTSATGTWEILSWKLSRKMGESGKFCMRPNDGQTTSLSHNWFIQMEPKFLTKEIWRTAPFRRLSIQMFPVPFGLAMRGAKGGSYLTRPFHIASKSRYDQTLGRDSWSLMHAS